jgi:hypothetical protein
MDKVENNKSRPSKILLGAIEVGYTGLFVLSGVAYGVSEALTAGWRGLENYGRRLRGLPSIEYIDAEDRLRVAVNEANKAERFSISDAEYQRIMAERERKSRQPAGYPSEIAP